MSDFNYVPKVSASVDFEPKINEVTFGDGNAQRTPQGINNNPQVWELVFVKKKSVGISILQFLDSKGGHTSFTWTPPNGTEAMFICKKWNGVLITRDIYSITATFDQVFE